VSIVPAVAGGWGIEHLPRLTNRIRLARLTANRYDDFPYETIWER
jgi:hypothetical protein